MKLNNFNSVYSLAQTLYDTTLNPNDFVDIALNGWEKIGNKYCVIKRLTADTVDRRIKLPCDVDYIISVNHSFNDAQMTSPKTVLYQIDTLFIEHYVERWKWLNNPIYQSGKLAKYVVEDDHLVFNHDYRCITVVYYEVLRDEDGLPFLTDKEVQALATYVTYSYMYKKALQTQNANAFQLAQNLKGEWVKACSAARNPEKISLNDINEVLDSQVKWDRKFYNKSYKP